MAGRRSTIERVCEVCGARFFPWQGKSGRSCSRRCSAKIALSASHTPEANARRNQSVANWRAANPERVAEKEARRRAATQTPEYRAAARARYDLMVQTGTGIASEENRNLTAALCKSVMRQARRELETETNFIELWTETFKRLRRENPFHGEVGTPEHTEWMREIGRAVTSDPAIRDLCDNFMREALPRLHARQKRELNGNDCR